MQDNEDDEYENEEFEAGFMNYEDSDRKRIQKLTVLSIVTTVMVVSFIPMEPPRIGNCRNDRRQALQYVRSWDDDMFRPQFRICREDFGNLLHKIAHLIQRNKLKSIASSDSSINPELRLMITLRILAGAKYLDMIWYRVNVDHVSEIVIDCARAINAALNNIQIPSTETDWILESDNFREVLRKKHGSIADDMLFGICGAGDGLVIQITVQVTTDLNGKPSRNYMNRKGFFALLVQAFCGAYTKFWYFNVGWPGVTNDITAYKQTELYRAATNSTIPDWVSFLLDEAYSSCGGRHLTPYSQHQLRRAYSARGENTMYYMMRTFDHVLSTQRISIERAFGQSVSVDGI